MTKFVIFVDGSNLFGSLKTLNSWVNEYDKFFNFILKKSLEVWKPSIISESEGVRLIRILWYVVGTIDNWDLSDPNVEKTIFEWYKKDVELSREYINLARAQGKTENIEQEAWAICFSKIKSWYSGKKSNIEKQKEFYFGVSSATDFIDIIQCGHLKVDILHRNLAEKGLDTFLAVDMVSLVDTYDVALVVSGDADSIPSIQRIKQKGKHVGVIEFIKGHPPEKKGRESSSKLKALADFVVPIYETDLLRENIVGAKQQHSF
jgi:uncharacterized LabA/DUF88 family protein